MRQKIPPTCCVQPRRKTGTVQQTPAAGRGQEGLMFVWPSVLPSIALTSGFSFLQQPAHGRRKKQKWLNQKEVELPTLSGRKDEKGHKSHLSFLSPFPKSKNPNPKSQTPALRLPFPGSVAQQRSRGRRSNSPGPSGSSRPAMLPARSSPSSSPWLPEENASSGSQSRCLRI